MTPRVHFIGIGGIGMSALAQYYLAMGWEVSGSDAARSEITDGLKKKSARIFIGQPRKSAFADLRGQRRENLKGPDLVVYSAAIKSDNREFSQARTKGYPLLSYAQAVGELTKKHFTIAVSGSHGKSTTTALLGLILVEAGLDPTIIIGTKLKELGDPSTMLGASNNFRLGRSKYLVLEADEYNRSFHHYHPQIAVLTNIDREHLDTYKNLGGVLAGFKKYIKNVASDGWTVANREDKNIRDILDPQVPPRLHSGQASPKFRLSSKIQTPKPRVIWYGRGDHKLLIPGVHNQFNAEAAWQAAKLLGVKKAVAEKVFRTFGGAWRRLEQLKTKNLKLKTVIYSDYAHHPTEVRATLQALKEKHPGQKIVCVFQPHQQDRLNRLFKEFTRAFNQADFTVIYPLYQVMGRDTVGLPSGDLPQVDKTSEDLVKAINRPSVVYARGLKKVLSLIKPYPELNSVVVFMSAGDLDNTVREYFSR